MLAVTPVPQGAWMVPSSVRIGWEHVFVYAADEVDRALELSRLGLSDHTVSRRLGIPRPTISRWRRDRPDRGSRRFGPPHDVGSYAYILGIYLGDGCLWSRGRSATLEVALDAAHPGIANEVEAAMREVVPDSEVKRYVGPRSVVRLRSSHPAWLEAFPQHGSGRKHERRILLERWQEEIVDFRPSSFLRGLIHSDGCRCINRFRTELPSGRTAVYEYSRYFFSNRSSDIRNLFCETCERIGVRWTQSNARNISVSDRSSVANLDGIVGPKT